MERWGTAYSVVPDFVGLDLGVESVWCEEGKEGGVCVSSDGCVER